MFRYFKVDNKTTEADLKKQKRKLAKENHPDMGGSSNVMSAINDEYNKALKYIKNPYTEPKTSQNQSRTNSHFNGFDDFFRQGDFDEFTKAYFSNDYRQKQRYYDDRYEKERLYRMQREREERIRYEEELRRRVYYFHTKIRFIRFRINDRDEIITGLNNHVKLTNCKLFVKKREKSKWYQLFETVEFKVKCRDKSKLNLCLNTLRNKFSIYNLKQGHEQI